jgi:hypothetical protein
VKRGTKFEQREYWRSNGCIGETEAGSIEGKVCKKKEWNRCQVEIRTKSMGRRTEAVMNIVGNEKTIGALAEWKYIGKRRNVSVH